MISKIIDKIRLYFKPQPEEEFLPIDWEKILASKDNSNELDFVGDKSLYKNNIRPTENDIILRPSTSYWGRECDDDVE